MWNRLTRTDKTLYVSSNLPSTRGNLSWLTLCVQCNNANIQSDCWGPQRYLISTKLQARETTQWLQVRQSSSSAQQEVAVWWFPPINIQDTQTMWALSALWKLHTQAPGQAFWSGARGLTPLAHSLCQICTLSTFSIAISDGARFLQHC